MIIFSHLLVKTVDEVVFLESTNETEVFTTEDFKHQKFDNCRKIIQEIQRDMFHENFEKWNRELFCIFSHREPFKLSSFYQFLNTQFI